MRYLVIVINLHQLFNKSHGSCNLYSEFISTCQFYNFYVAAMLGMGGGVLVGGIPGMPAMVQQMPGAAVQQLGGQLGGQLGLIGMPRFR